MTLVVTHPFVSTKTQGNDSTRVYGPQWNADHTIVGTADASQLNGNVVQAVTNDTNVTGSIASQTITLGWTGTLAAARLNANVVQGITNDTNVTGSISAQNLTFSWAGKLALSRGGTNADLSITGGAANYLKQASLGGTVTVGTIPASDIASGAALTKVNDTNVTLTLGGSPTSALLAATSVTLGWTGTLAASRGGFGADVSAQSGVPLFATGAATFTGTNGTGNFVRTTSPALVTPALGTPSSGTLTSCTGLPLSTGVTGNLPVANLGSGTSASSATFWRGDGTWATPAGGGTVSTTGTPAANQTAVMSGAASITGIGPGNVGQRLTSNGSGSNPSYTDGGWTLLNTLTASASATLTDTTSISSSYTEYEIVFENVLSATDLVSMLLQVQVGGSFQTTSYIGTEVKGNGTSATSTSVTTGIPVGPISNTISTGPGVNARILLSNPSQTSAIKLIYGTYIGTNTTPKAIPGTSGGAYNGGNGAVTGIQLIMSSGNIASGVMKIYGRV